MSPADLDKIFNDIKSLTNPYKNQGHRNFIFVYCTGYGILGKDQDIILNKTTDNIYSIQRALRDICNSSQKMTTVFALYNVRNLPLFDRT